MFEFLRRSFGAEKISDKTIVHSSKGEYTTTNRLKGGGHGQEALNYMEEHGIEYHITKTYPNGVRVGNVPTHIKKAKRSGERQSWFPRNWDRKKIKKAGRAVSGGKKYPDGKTKSKTIYGVTVGIKRTNGEIATIFPLSIQKTRRKKWTKNA